MKIQLKNSSKKKIQALRVHLDNFKDLRLSHSTVDILKKKTLWNTNSQNLFVETTLSFAIKCFQSLHVDEKYKMETLTNCWLEVSLSPCPEQVVSFDLPMGMDAKKKKNNWLCNNPQTRTLRSIHFGGLAKGDQTAKTQIWENH